MSNPDCAGQRTYMYQVIGSLPSLKERQMQNLDPMLASLAEVVNSIDSFTALDVAQQMISARRTQLKSVLITEHIPLFGFTEYYDEDGNKHRGFVLQHHKASITVRTESNESINVPFERIGSLGVLL